MSKTLEELEQEMLDTCNVTIAGTYTIFKTLSGKLAQIAQIYALEQQIEQLTWVLESLGITGLDSLVLNDRIEGLQKQLKALKDGKE